MKDEHLSRLKWVILLVLGIVIGFPESMKATNDSGEKKIAKTISKGRNIDIVALADETLDKKSQSGFHMLLGIEDMRLVESFMKTQAVQLKSFFDNEKIIYSDLSILSDREITFELLDPSDVAKVKKMLAQAREAIPGVSLAENGLKFSFKITDEGVQGIRSLAIQNAVEIIQNRLLQFGLTGQTVVKQDEEKIAVDIPGLKTEEERERIFKLISHQGALQFMVIDERKDVDTGVIYPDAGTGKKYLLRSIPIVLASRVYEAKVGFDTDSHPIVSFSLRKFDTKRVADFAGRQRGKHIAVVLSNKVYATSLIDSGIYEGQGQLSNNFTVRDAHDLAIVLRSGAMLAPMHRIENRSNQDSVININDCRSKAFIYLQLAAVEEFQKGDHKKALELFQQASHLCPSDVMTKDMIIDLKKEMM